MNTTELLLSLAQQRVYVFQGHFRLTLERFKKDTKICNSYPCADKSLARPGSKQARRHVSDAREFSNIETRAVIKSPPPLQGKALKEIHAILTETLACFLPGQAKDLSVPLHFFLRLYKMF